MAIACALILDMLLSERCHDETEIAAVPQPTTINLR